MRRKNSQSPVRAHGSPHRRSPSKRERSPVRHHSSNTKKSPTRNRSPKRVLSPVREKSYKRTKSSHPRKSPPSGSPSPVRQKLSNQTRSPERGPSPVREKPLHRSKPSDRRKSPPARPPSPVRQKLPNQSRSTKQEKLRPSPPVSPLKEKPSSRARSPKHVKSRPSVSRSPDSLSLSPRSKRLKRVAAERDSQKGKEREHEKNHGKKSDRDLERDLTIEKTYRRSERDEVSNGGSRSRHRQLDSPTDRHPRGPRRSRSPDNRRRDERENSRDHDQSDSVAKMKAVEETLDAKEKQKPSFELSGKLAAETNRVRGVTLLFNEPPDARKPEIRWRFYVFKGGEALNEPLYVHRQSCYLFGRERRVADIPTDHPSCSKQHAVLQYRQVEEEKPDGTMAKRVRPYMMDLGSTNGTFINENQMEPQRYYELFEKDTIKFGNSSREYVLLHENST